jgi:hypothetical protein
MPNKSARNMNGRIDAAQLQFTRQYYSSFVTFFPACPVLLVRPLSTHQEDAIRSGTRLNCRAHNCIDIHRKDKAESTFEAAAGWQSSGYTAPEPSQRNEINVPALQPQR